MTNNLFQFGDTYWLQTDGTAMGVSPSCVYATIYFAQFEEDIVKKYPEIVFYRRYIDDVFIIWLPLGNNDTYRWNTFQKEFNSFGKLRWEFTKRQHEINFLDLQITIKSNGKIATRIYEKAENCYLYLPATSSHPPGNLKSLVFGMVHRTLRLTSELHHQKQELQRLLLRLTARGYAKSLILQTINKAYQQISQSVKHNNTLSVDCNKNCFFHLQYHPQDVKSCEFQKLFDKVILAPPYRTPLPELKNHRQHPIGINRMIVAYHRTPNLGNLLSPRVLNNKDGPLVSSYI
jgi:hypothetical protein